MSLVPRYLDGRSQPRGKSREMQATPTVYPPPVGHVPHRTNTYIHMYVPIRGHKSGSVLN